MIALDPIGRVRSPFATPLDAPRQGHLATAESVLEIDARFVRGLDGVVAGGRLLVLWWADGADRSVLGRPGSAGVFSLRTPHRPNPVCVTEVTVRSIEGGRLVVAGLDAVDGSPILDLKSAAAEAEGWFPLPGIGPALRG